MMAVPLPLAIPMPIYAFRCAACGHAFDRLQKMSDPDPAKCPECGAGVVERQVTAPSFRLSGSGWYETDFKKDGDKKRNLAGDSKTGDGKGESGKSSDTGKAEPASGAKSDNKPADAKPAAKPPAKTDVKPVSKPD